MVLLGRYRDKLRHFLFRLVRNIYSSLNVGAGLFVGSFGFMTVRFWDLTEQETERITVDLSQKRKTSHPEKSRVSHRNFELLVSRIEMSSLAIVFQILYIAVFRVGRAFVFKYGLK